MAPISFDQLLIIVEKQDERISRLQNEIEKLKDWSDLNDHYLQEMIDSQGAAVDRLRTAITELHEADQINARIEELEAEETTPVAQLLRTFVEKHATEEEIFELNN